MENNNLKNKIIFITGASRGLGRHLCKHFGNLGLRVAALARNIEELKSLKKEFDDMDGLLSYFPLDVTDFDGIAKAVENIINTWGSIDILINCAGVGRGKPFDQCSKEDIDVQIDTNLKGLMYVTRLVCPIMIKNRYGYVFNISSVGGTRGLPIPGAEVYSSTKFGVNGFGEALFKYLNKFDVHMTTLCPGGMNTSWWGKGDYKHGDDKDILIQPEEVANLIELILKGRPSTIFKNVIFIPRCEADEW